MIAGKPKPMVITRFIKTVVPLYQKNRIDYIWDILTVVIKHWQKQEKYILKRQPVAVIVVHNVKKVEEINLKQPIKIYLDNV